VCRVCGRHSSSVSWQKKSDNGCFEYEQSAGRHFVEDLISSLFRFTEFKRSFCIMKISTAEPGYNDVGLCDTPPIASDILW
jgi:hypothetical protein